MVRQRRNDAAVGFRCAARARWLVEGDGVIACSLARACDGQRPADVYKRQAKADIELVGANDCSIFKSNAARVIGMRDRSHDKSVARQVLDGISTAMAKSPPGMIENQHRKPAVCKRRVCN